jgi:glycosyltransferase involved in cell wall biosynthesis
MKQNLKKISGKGSPKFSILIPTYNREEYLVESLDSALKQTYKDYEIIISDNCSTDNTVELLKKYTRTHKNIKFYSQKKNLGTVRNIKFLINKAKGDYSLFLFDDDLLDKEALHEFSNILSKQKNIVYIYTSIGWIDKNSKIILTNVPTKTITNIKKYGLFKYKDAFGMCGGVFKTGIVKIIDNSTAIDHILSLELSANGNGIIYDGKLYKYRFHPNNESQREDLFDTSVRVFDTLKKFHSKLPLDVKKDLEVYILNQKYLLYLSSIIYNALSRHNFQKGLKRKKILDSKTSFFHMSTKSIFVFIKNFMKVLITTFKYKQNK